MGIDTHALQLLRHAKTRHGDLGTTLTLGRLAVLLGPRAMRKWTGHTQGAWCEPLLRDRFGAGEVDSIDNSDYEGATIVADFNQPVSGDLANRYDSVLDFGFTEHIFDAAQSLRNIASLCRIGGRILHVLPSNGFCGHGFYQFSPEMLLSWYSADNGFSEVDVFLADLCDTRHWYRVDPPKNGERINIRSSGEVYIIALAKRTGQQHAVAQQSDYSFLWKDSAGKQVASRAPGKFSAVRELLYRAPVTARLAYALNARASANGARPLRSHASLSRIPLPPL